MPVSGRGDGPDVAHSWLAIEVKSRRVIASWIKAARRQAEKAAKPVQLPIMVIHECGTRFDDDLVVLRMGDFKDWFGGMNES